MLQKAIAFFSLVLIFFGQMEVLYGWATWRRRLVGPGLVVAGLSLFFINAEETVFRGSAGYSMAEFQLTFVDPDDRPVKGIELRVENLEGTNFFYYPVTDYLPGQIPTSDQNGLMAFHHIPQGVEWDVKWVRIDYAFFDTSDVLVGNPQFVCRFLRDGVEVHRIGYSDLCRQGGLYNYPATCPVVKRRRPEPGWPVTELFPHAEDNQDTFDARRQALFDFNHSGKLEREERIVFHQAEWAAMKLEFEQRAQKGGEAEIAFAVVRKQIVIRSRGR